MKRIVGICVAVAIALACVSCGNSTPTEKKEPTPQATAPAVPNDIQTAATTDLGSEAEVIAFGDLAKNGKTQALVVNRLKVTPRATVPGILLSRASIIEHDNGRWQEIFRCDEHLQNEKGYLGRTPLAAVGSWRLQIEKSPEKGLEMYFTPLKKPAGGYIETLGIRWNPQVKRYESLDASYQHFLTEQPTLEIPQSPVHL
jgi:hypothetical protein